MKITFINVPESLNANAIVEQAVRVGRIDDLTIEFKASVEPQEEDLIDAYEDRFNGNDDYYNDDNEEEEEEQPVQDKETRPMTELKSGHLQKIAQIVGRDYETVKQYAQDWDIKYAEQGVNNRNIPVEVREYLESLIQQV